MSVSSQQVSDVQSGLPSEPLSEAEKLAALQRRQAARIGKTLAELSSEQIRELKDDTPLNQCNIQVTHAENRIQKYRLGFCNGSATLFDTKRQSRHELLGDCEVIY